MCYVYCILRSIRFYASRRVRPFFFRFLDLFVDVSGKLLVCLSVTSLCRMFSSFEIYDFNYFMFLQEFIHMHSTIYVA